MDNRIDELYESWINGNRTWVVTQIIEQRSKRAAAQMAAALAGLLSDADRDVFTRLLEK